MRDEEWVVRQVESVQAVPSHADVAPAHAGAARSIGMTVRRFRHSRGWSLQELAERSALSYQFLSEVETGKRNFSVGTLAKLSDALGVELVAVVMAAYGLGSAPKPISP